MLNSEYLNNLNENQKEATLYTDGPLLIVAGAGSGKTRVLTSRIAHLIKQHKAFPNQIIKMSFVVTESISPNNKPIISNLINERKPIMTSPTAILECARRPNNASPGNLVLFCKLNKSNATIPETKNTDKEILILKEKANVTPNNDE